MVAGYLIAASLPAAAIAALLAYPIACLLSKLWIASPRWRMPIWAHVLSWFATAQLAATLIGVLQSVRLVPLLFNPSKPGTYDHVWIFGIFGGITLLVALAVVTIARRAFGRPEVSKTEKTGVAT